MNEKEKAMKGYMFRQGDPELAKEREIASDLCFRLNNLHPKNNEEKQKILHELIGNIKGAVNIIPPFRCDYGRYISVGDHFFANYNTKIIDGGKVIFGDDVRIAPDCTFVTVNHSLDPELRKNGYQIYKDIVVGNNVWFGVGVKVMPGVKIGDNAVICAGSVVVKDIPANVLAGGVPCRVIREINEEDKYTYHIEE